MRHDRGTEIQGGQIQLHYYVKISIYYVYSYYVSLSEFLSYERNGFHSSSFCFIAVYSFFMGRRAVRVCVHLRSCV